MGYLIPSDYNRFIQDVSISQVVSGNAAYQPLAEVAAQAEISSYLRQKYDVAKEFTNTSLYNPQATYSAADRVYLDATAYNAAATYVQGQLTLQGGKIYQCTTTISVPEAFNVLHWVLLGNQFDIFYGNYPYPVFNLYGQYKVGDHISWNNHSYTCKIASIQFDHETVIQLVNTNNIPFRNVFPDDVVNGPANWTDNGLFVIPAGNLLTTTPSQTITLFQARDDLNLITGTTPNLIAGASTYTAPAQGQPGSLVGWHYGIERPGAGTLTAGTDYTKNANGFTLLNGIVFNPGEKFVIHFVPITDEPVPVDTTGLNAFQIIMTYFTKGDNRNQQMLMYMVDIVLYHLYSRIAPKSIPELRVDRYNAAIIWLQRAAKGDITADLTVIQPKAGARFRSGSNVKQINSY
jgi:phage gp36-like protein